VALVMTPKGNVVPHSKFLLLYNIRTGIWLYGDRTKWNWTKWYGQNGMEKLSLTKW